LYSLLKGEIMGQRSVLEVLKKYPKKWFRTKDIAELLISGKCTVSHSLNKLKRWGEVESKTITMINEYKSDYRGKCNVKVWRFREKRK